MQVYFVGGGYIPPGSIVNEVFRQELGRCGCPVQIYLHPTDYIKNVKNRGSG